jgi:antitoxin CcdA
MRRQKPKATTKRATTISVSSDLLSAARDAGINLSATLERALMQELTEPKQKKWLRDNREAITAYNEHVEKQGTFFDGSRSF